MLKIVARSVSWGTLRAPRKLMDSMVSVAGRSGAGAPGAAGLAWLRLGRQRFRFLGLRNLLERIRRLGLLRRRLLLLKSGRAASMPIMDARRLRGLENCIYSGFLSTLRLVCLDAWPPNWVSDKVTRLGTDAPVDSTAA
nr:hypothetical protein [uncultured bacterium]